MSRTRTLANLRADVRFQADVEGATARHTDAQLTRLINQSIQAWREIISDAGHHYFLTVTNTVVNAGDTTVTFPGAGALSRIYGVDVEYDGEWRELFPFDLAERNKYEAGAGGNEQGIPTYYHVDYDSTAIRIIPECDGSYNVRFWCLTNHSDLSSDSDTFDGILGWEDWVVFDVAVRIAVRDANVNDNYQFLVAERDKIERRIRDAAKKLQRDKPGRRLPTRERRLELEDANRWHWWRS